jgi:hypothetical protein
MTDRELLKTLITGGVIVDLIGLYFKLRDFDGALMVKTPGRNDIVPTTSLPYGKCSIVTKGRIEELLDGEAFKLHHTPLFNIGSLLEGYKLEFNHNRIYKINEDGMLTVNRVTISPLGILTETILGRPIKERKKS